MVLMPVIVPFFQSVGIGMEGVYILQSVFAVTVFICEIPSGYISDLLGRKKTLIVAFFLKGLGFSLFPFAQDLSLLIIAEIILGFSVSLFSGTDTAIIYDTLEAMGSKKAQIKILGKSISAGTFGEACASLIASLLMLVSFNPYQLSIISAIFSWISFFIAFSIIEPPRLKMNNTHKENFKYIYRGLFKQSTLMNLILLNTIFYFSSTLFAVWMFQKYWENIHIPLVYFGFLWGIYNLVVSICSRYAYKIEKHLGSSVTLILIGLFPIAGYFGISFIDHFLGVVICLSFQVCRGLGQVILKDALNKRVTADFRATANSISQMGVRILFTIIGPIIGVLIDKKGLSDTTLIMVIFYCIVFVAVMIPLVLQRKNFMQISKA